MELVDLEYLNKYSNEDYVWYACYVSNINYNRFMYYINGDINENYGTINGCVDKSKPVEEKKYIFKCPIYFSGESKNGVEEWLSLITKIVVMLMGKYIR